MSKADKILRTIEKMSEMKFLPIIGPRKGQILVEVIKRIKPKHILEIGTFIGYSAILMGKELGSDAHIITIEIDADEAKAAKENIRQAEIKPVIEVLVGDAKEVLPRIKDEFDMVFIDGEKREYKNYLLLIENQLHKGSVVVADNAGIYEKLMRDYLNYVRTSGKYESEYIPSDEDGVEVSTKL
jgi:predicted O-methyltransferase YrrM